MCDIHSHEIQLCGTSKQSLMTLKYMTMKYFNCAVRPNREKSDDLDMYRHETHELWSTSNQSKSTSNDLDMHGHETHELWGYVQTE